ncbi:MAG: hypothetical protein ACP5KY_00080 [Thermoproteus sp.]
MERSNRQARPQREEVNVAELISEVVYEYLSRELGEEFVEAEVEVAFDGNSVTVSVEAGAGALVEEDRLREIVDKAAELGITVADLVKEGAVQPSDDRRHVLREALKRIRESA